MHSSDSYHCTITAFGMEIPPQQPGTRVGCGAPPDPTAGTECSLCTMHQHRGQNLPTALTLVCQKG